MTAASPLGHVEPFRVPKQTAVEALRKRLVESFGMDDAAAMAIASAVDDPAQVRRQLQVPTTLKVPGGTLSMVSTRISSIAVLPHLTNGRVVGATPYPASGQDAQKYWAEQDLATDDDYPGQLVLSGGTPADVAEAFAQSYVSLEAQNSWDDSIRDGGVFAPITVAPMTIEFEEGASRTFLTAIDGSSRIASCHRVLGIAPEDVLFGTLADPRNARAWLRTRMAVLDRSDDEISEQEIQHARAASVPATVVVGFTPDLSGNGDIKRALDSYVSLIHIESPRPWNDEAKENKLADAVMDALLEHEAVTVEEALWLAGYLTDEEAVDAGFPVAHDIRAARFLNLVRTDSQTPLGYAIGAAVRRLRPDVGRASYKHKAPIPAAMAIRSAHAQSLRKPIMNVLSRIYQMKSVWVEPWEVTPRDPDEILEAAIAELAADAEMGPSALELGVLASYYLATERLLLGPGPGTKGQDETVDKRWPDVMLARLLRDPDGLRLLRDILVAGRAGENAWVRDEHGRVKRTGAGEKIKWDNITIRKAFPSEGGGSPGEPDASPAIRLQAGLRALRGRVEEVVLALDALREIQSESGEVLIDKTGIDKTRASQILTDLRNTTDTVTRYGVIGEFSQRSSEPHAGDEDE